MNKSKLSIGDIMDHDNTFNEEQYTTVPFGNRIPLNIDNNNNNNNNNTISIRARHYHAQNNNNVRNKNNVSTSPPPSNNTPIQPIPLRIVN